MTTSVLLTTTWLLFCSQFLVVFVVFVLVLLGFFPSTYISDSFGVFFSPQEQLVIMVTTLQRRYFLCFPSFPATGPM